MADLGLSEIRLLTNNPKKTIGLESYGLKVVETVPIICRRISTTFSIFRQKRIKWDMI